MVTSPNGMETLVFRGEGILDPLNKEDKIVMQSSAQENVASTTEKTNKEKRNSETTI